MPQNDIIKHYKRNILTTLPQKKYKNENKSTKFYLEFLLKRC